ncbi:glycosyltransferase [Paracoccus subflavus]|uniref:Glycosyltransferase n=1 Tax=Paracoccus subflavus TaxID=2528244 RepID=A0A4Q9FZC8_9RHOB|nr:glycosyltransferase family 4 protein [Paracoccus subflavus]TBN38656.1 glycosyltransferase [Paracoccus subflavus]
MDDAAETPTFVLVIPDFPTADTGGGQRSLLFLDAAAALGPVHVVILSDDMPDNASRCLPQAASIAGWGTWDKGNANPTGIRRFVPRGVLRLIAPAQFAQPDPEFRARLDDLVTRTGAKAVLFRYFNALTVTGFSKRDGVAAMVDIDDRDDQKYAARLVRLFGKRLAASGLPRMSVRRLTRMMQERLSAASLVWFAAPEDVWPLPGVRTVVLPNVASIMPDKGALPPPSQGDSILFVGIYNHVPNRDGIRWFLDHCWADLARRCPDVRLRIVGRGTLWPQMAARYSHLERVDFVGPVDDLAAEYGRARLCICPVREGGGSKIKVIEAAAMGRPIVGVSHAFRGFDQGILDHAVEAATPQDFVAACADILTDGARADRAGAALAEWQRQHYSRNAILTRIRSDIISVRE